MVYIEPPYWHQPVRHHLGALLLKAGRPAEAEQRYREDLKRFPNNAWSLAGLAASLKAQGKDAEAAEVEAQLAATGADAKLVASRF
jgi:Flp pilus assembly protein TadD